MTNASAMTALKTLTTTNKSLQQTQARISTGYRVAEASDNAAYWSIATTMRSDNKALSTVQDALGLGAAKVDTAYTGVKSAIEVVDEIKAKLVAARETGVDRTKIQSEITQLQGQLINNAANSSFSGENWLSVNSSSPGYNATKTVVSSFTRASDGSITIGTIAIDTTAITLIDAGPQNGILDSFYSPTTGAPAGAGFTVTTLDISTLTNNPTDLTTLESYIKGVDNALGRMTTAASNLGAAKKRISLQQDFVTALMDAIDRGVGQLVDADMNKESTRLQALQVQQQLGIQSLTIANSNAQGVLSLFQN
jgi:flagellin